MHALHSSFHDAADAIEARHALTIVSVHWYAIFVFSHHLYHWQQFDVVGITPKLSVVLSMTCTVAAKPVAGGGDGVGGGNGEGGFGEGGGGDGGGWGGGLNCASATDDTTASHTPARATSPRGRAILRSAMCSMFGFESSKPNKSTDQFGIEALVLELVLLSARPLADHKSGGK